MNFSNEIIKTKDKQADDGLRHKFLLSYMVTAFPVLDTYQVARL